MQPLGLREFRGRTLAEWKRSGALALHMLAEPLDAPPGHHTSPVIGQRDVAWAARPQPEISAIDLHADEQVKLLGELDAYWHDLPHEPRDGWRYRSSGRFQPTDATVYYGMLQHLKPKQLIEVGSGFTSALALDTRDRHLPDLRLTFIEPYPEQLHSLLRDSDRAACEIIPTPVQDVPLDTFDRLQAGDVLFLDTSHFAKTGSEVNWLVFNVLPRLAPGVIVHIHDMFWPFEYPAEWLEQRLSYSELYLVRAFLMFNATFDILLFGSWAWKTHPELFTALDKNYSGGEPGSLWLRRVAP